ncbi:lipase 1-like [Cydia pomonella]|uniref:lipase 1-like n=1 Tax=Cydia pomonella TaxID=82600 RepID=UPI002ADD9461|nr:lipase 1-like [Cydia pomonella]
MNTISSTVTIFLFISVTATFFITPGVSKPSEDATLSITEFGIKYGHSVKEHDVVTEDGYILTLFHIPGKTKRSILLMHGILDSSDTFILRGNLSLIITLANKGYNVWAGNTRGNKYGRRHKYLDPDTDAEFWDFSFHETGYYDLAALVDFILVSTDEQSIRTIGHSQGTTANFVLLSSRPEYNEKIKGFIALAPATFLRNVRPPASNLAKEGPAINRFLKSLGIEELLGDQLAASELYKLLCSQRIFSYYLCFLSTVLPIVGIDPTRIEPEFWEVIIGHNPSGTSRKSIIHYFQLIFNKRFANYDYGPVENFRRYKSLIPPSYNLKQVTTNVSLFVGQNDPLVTVKDVDILRLMLPKDPKYHLMEPELWNHIDFIWANDMDVYLYPYIFSSLQDFE